MPNDDAIDLETALVGVLALLIAQREDVEAADRRKTEVVLSDAGMSPTQIGRLLGKRPDAVRMAISRARKR